MKKVLLPVLFASAGLMLLAGCKENPAAVTKKYIKACQDGDEIAARKLVSSKEMKQDAQAQAMEGRNEKAIRNAKFSDPIIKDDKAVVLMTYETYRFVNLEKIEGKWKVTGFNQKSPQNLD